jgi:hypothetical protein
MANPEDQPVSAVQQYIDAFNKGDARQWLRCASILCPYSTEWPPMSGTGLQQRRIGTRVYWLTVNT